MAMMAAIQETLWAREMTQQIKSLLHKHEDISSNPQYPHKKVLQHVSIIPVLSGGGGAEEGSTGDLAS